jgi:DNA-binding beta-propeller fold protein YncE
VALIADEMNNRLLIIDPSGRTLWQYPRPGDLAAGQTFKTPDDAHLTPSGKQIIASEQDDHVVRVIDIATRKIVYTYGMPGVRGSGPNQLNQPESALMLPSGHVVVPDMMNCRLVMIPAGAHAISRQLGRTGASHGACTFPVSRVYTRATRSAPTVTSLSTTRARARS